MAETNVQTAYPLSQQSCAYRGRYPNIKLWYGNINIQRWLLRKLKVKNTVYSLRRYTLTAALNDWMVDNFLICNGKEFHSLAPATVKDFS